MARGPGSQKKLVSVFVVVEQFGVDGRGWVFLVDPVKVRRFSLEKKVGFQAKSNKMYEKEMDFKVFSKVGQFFVKKKHWFKQIDVKCMKTYWFYKNFTQIQ